MDKLSNLNETKISSIIWLRRDLRLYDHISFYNATRKSGFIQPIFIFDPNILCRFSNKNDKRLSFLAEVLIDLQIKLSKKAGSLLVFYGNPIEIIPKLATLLNVEQVFAGEDYEPENIKRDKSVKQKLYECGIEFISYNDHLLIKPNEILKSDGLPYKIFTPYSRAWKQTINYTHYHCFNYDDNGRYYPSNKLKRLITQANLNLLKDTTNPEELLSQIGYHYSSISAWRFGRSFEHLNSFMNDKIHSYSINRDNLAIEGTSKLSPYIRFGIISIRDCYRRAQEAENSGTWINELIWRDFYAMIMYYFPNSAKGNFQEKYKNKLKWPNNAELLESFYDAKTGYPLVDAAIRQLVTTGWMHNRARMIVASFLTKHLLTDWRIGEDFFAQYLMDYELTSNVGGWQWAASTGTDAQPYFRVFNPTLQSQKFDPEGTYIKRFIPELACVPSKYIHQPLSYKDNVYYPPIVDHNEARIKAINFFKCVSPTLPR